MRLPHAAKQLPPHMLLGALKEGATLLTDFLAHHWRPRRLSPDAHYISAVPSYYIGTMRSALYQEV